MLNLIQKIISTSKSVLYNKKESVYFDVLCNSTSSIEYLDSNLNVDYYAELFSKYNLDKIIEKIEKELETIFQYENEYVNYVVIKLIVKYYLNWNLICEYDNMFDFVKDIELLQYMLIDTATGGSKVNLEQSTISGLTTAVTAGAFGATGKVTSTGLNYVKDYAVRGAFAGVTADVTYQYLNNGITRDNNKVTGYSIGQAINNYNLNQTIRSGGIGAVMTPIGAKIVETAIVKFGPYKNFDLQNPESFKGAKLKNVERYLDKNIKSKDGYEKSSIKKGTGIRYYKPNGGGKSYQLNYGYEKSITNGADNIHIKPYLKTTVGSEKTHIPLK